MSENIGAAASRRFYWQGSCLWERRDCGRGRRANLRTVRRIGGRFSLPGNFSQIREWLELLLWRQSHLTIIISLVCLASWCWTWCPAMTEGICKAGLKGGLRDCRSNLVRYFFKCCDRSPRYFDNIQSDWLSMKILCYEFFSCSVIVTPDFEDILLLAWECQAPIICRHARDLGVHCCCFSVESSSRFTSKHMKY